jgi:addiction module HigA family antidote
MLNDVSREAVLAAVRRRHSSSTPKVPPLPGSVLREQYLEPNKITQAQLARMMGVSNVAVSYIVHGRNAISADMALRLGKATETPPQFWLRLQAEYDLYQLQNGQIL